MLIESIGGECPICKYDHCYLRYSPTNSGWFQYIACPKCGFGYSESCNGKEEYRHADLWKVIEEHEGRTREEIYHKFKNIPRDTEIEGSIWIFSKEEIEEFKKQHIPVFI